MNPDEEYPRKARVIRFEEGEGDSWRSDASADPQPAASGVAPVVGSSRIEPTADPRVTERRAEPPRAASVATPSGPASAPPLASSVPTPPARRGSDRRPWLLAGAAAILLGVVGGLWLQPGRDRAETDETATTTTTTTETATAPADPAAATVIAGAYRNPEAASVERALVSVRADYASGGASAVAAQARACFDSLARAPGYGELDYCLAYDAYGAALARRLAQGQPLPAGSWFAETEQRALRTAQTVIGTNGDPAARLLDIRRLTVAVASANPAERTETASARPQPQPQAAAPVDRAVPRPVEVARAQTAPEPRLAPIPPFAPEPRTAPRAPRPPEPVAAPPVQRVVIATPRARPSFNCRNARTSAEQLVCSDPVLAAADWRLHNAFEQASAQSPSPRALRLEQDRWLAVREAAAPDPRAVLDVYEQRIDELTRGY
jgi:hypothetical protein